jgi:hypothetical protein
MTPFHATEPWQDTQHHSLEEAIELARGHIAGAHEEGVEGIPDYIHFVVPDDPDSLIPANAWASYARLGDLLGTALVHWRGRTPRDPHMLHPLTGRLPVRIHPRVLESEEAIVAVIAHEVYEIVHLRQAFAENQDVLPGGTVYQLISPDVPGNLHYRAVAFGDRLVRAMRGQ